MMKKPETSKDAAIASLLTPIVMQGQMRSASGPTMPAR